MKNKYSTHRWGIFKVHERERERVRERNILYQPRGRRNKDRGQGKREWEKENSLINWDRVDWPRVIKLPGGLSASHYSFSSSSSPPTSGPCPLHLPLHPSLLSTHSLTNTSYPTSSSKVPSILKKVLCPGEGPTRAYEMLWLWLRKLIV